jgi:RND family efflux transporter MFP subunit
VAIGRDGVVLRQLRTLYNAGVVAELTDGQLLERFATERGEAAELSFAALVERHGPMVLRVCRGVLNDPHDSQDAFQATFLVLVKRARALWVRDSLGPWLHQVAFRTASCARSAAARRRKHERRAAASPEESRAQADHELAGVLHEEINRLPDRYQAPVVLCDLEGRTHEQAARHLGWPVGTVKSRLSRGRERLRGRLVRRGVAPSAVPLAAGPSPDAPADPIPPALADSTAGTVIRLATARATVRGPAATLAQGVLRSMAMTHGVKVASVLLALGASAGGLGLLAGKTTAGAGDQPGANPQAARADALPAAPVRPGPLKVTVDERGVVESSRAEDVYCQVEGETTIVRIVPEGTRVKKGQVVCELDSSALRDKLINQEITTRAAEAAYQNAKLDREIAEIALVEYKQGIFKQEQAAARGAITAAESGIRKAGARLERTRQARQRLKDTLAPKGGAESAGEILAELEIDDRIENTEATLAREKTAIELGRTKLETLERFIGPKTTKELEAEVERKRANELAKQATWDLEKIKENKLRKQIVNCTLLAPIVGHVVYANASNRGAGQPTIEEGATVRPRQKIFSLPDLTAPWRVNAQAHERQIAQIKPGLRARVRIDAFPDELLTGVVESVAPLPDPGAQARGIHVFSTEVKLDDGPGGLRPGMTAFVKILVGDLDNVLTVPTQAVLHYDGKDHVALKKPGGGFEWREVTLGAKGDKLVEVKEGLQSGESVILDPAALRKAERQEKPGAGQDPAR